MCENSKVVFDESVELADNAMLKVRPELFWEWDFEKNSELGLDVYKMTKGSDKKVWWICNEGHSIDVPIANRVKTKACRICSNKEILIGYNDMWTTKPALAKLLLNSEDGYRLTYSSNRKADWKCLDCGEEIYQKYVNNVNRVGLSCPVCSDGVSFPEKFIYHILKEKNIDFKFEKIFDWANRKKFDFYIPSLNCIIEVHGEHHFTGKFKNIYMRDETGNDTTKKRLALENGIQHYIEIDARISSGEHIAESILNLDSPIKPYLLTDFKKIEEKASNSLMKGMWDLWNQGLGVTQISKETNICRPTVRKYLKRGASAGVCDYTIEKSRRRGRDLDSIIKANPVIQLDKNLEFIKQWDSCQTAAKELKTSSSSIHKVCQGDYKTAGDYRWMYPKDYEKIKGKIMQLDLDITHNGRSVVQLSQQGEFVKEWKSLASAGRELGISASGICAVCNGEQRTSGGFMWAYRKDFDEGSMPHFTEKSGHKRKVVQLDKDMNYIKMWDSASEAAKTIGLEKSSGITLVCQGKQKTSGGFKWAYTED